MAADNHPFWPWLVFCVWMMSWEVRKCHKPCRPVVQLPVLYRPQIIRTEHSTEVGRSEPWVIQEEGCLCRGTFRGSRAYNLGESGIMGTSHQRDGRGGLKGSILVCGVVMWIWGDFERFRSMFPVRSLWSSCCRAGRIQNYFLIRLPLLFLFLHETSFPSSLSTVGSSWAKTKNLVVRGTIWKCISWAFSASILS